MATPLTRRLPYPTLLEVGESLKDPALVARVINSAVTGNLNAIGEVKILAGTNSTTVRGPHISPQSFFAWQALDADGAALIPTLWLDVRGVRETVFRHAAPPVDLWLEYLVIG